MKFDYTKGQDAKYQVCVHRWNGDDFYIVHYFKSAKKLFEELKASEKDEGTTISIVDIKKASYKAYAKV